MGAQPGQPADRLAVYSPIKQLPESRGEETQTVRADFKAEQKRWAQ